MRLFTAVDLPADIRTRFTTLLDQLRPLAKLQWTAPEKLHITTAFIGEWPEARLEELHAALTLVKSDAFPIAVQGVRWMNKRVLCAGIQESPALVPRPRDFIPFQKPWAHTQGWPDRVRREQNRGGADLAALASSTGAALAAIGVPMEDREYHPHLTLARNKHPGRLPQLDRAVAELRSSDFGIFPATKFGLFLSHGGKYTQIREYALGAVDKN